MIALGRIEIDARSQTERDQSPTVVVLRKVRKSFGARTVLDGIDLEIPQGQFVALLGRSGTGKTTLLRLLSGLEEADDGTVLVPKARTTVYQEPRLVPSMRVLSNVRIGQPSTRRTYDAALTALHQVGMSDHAQSWPGTLSGGEAQRVALARALVREPDLLLLDEPFASLDALTRLQMQDLVRTLLSARQPATVLVTHDVDEALLLADRALVLTNGRFSLDLEIRCPRDRDDPHFAAYRRTLLGELGVSVS